MSSLQSHVSSARSLAVHSPILLANSGQALILDTKDRGSEICSPTKKSPPLPPPIFSKLFPVQFSNRSNSMPPTCDTARHPLRSPAPSLAFVPSYKSFSHPQDWT